MKAKPGLFTFFQSSRQHDRRQSLDFPNWLSTSASSGRHFRFHCVALQRTSAASSVEAQKTLEITSYLCASMCISYRPSFAAARCVKKPVCFESPTKEILGFAENENPIKKHKKHIFCRPKRPLVRPKKGLRFKSQNNPKKIQQKWPSQKKSHPKFAKADPKKSPPLEPQLKGLFSFGKIQVFSFCKPQKVN